MKDITYKAMRFPSAGEAIQCGGFNVGISHKSGIAPAPIIQHHQQNIGWPGGVGGRNQY